MLKYNMFDFERKSGNKWKPVIAFCRHISENFFDSLWKYSKQCESFEDNPFFYPETSMYSHFAVAINNATCVHLSELSFQKPVGAKNRLPKGTKKNVLETQDIKCTNYMDFWCLNKDTCTSIEIKKSWIAIKKESNLIATNGFKQSWGRMVMQTKSAGKAMREMYKTDYSNHVSIGLMAFGLYKTVRKNMQNESTMVCCDSLLSDNVNKLFSSLNADFLFTVDVKKWSKSNAFFEFPDSYSGGNSVSIRQYIPIIGLAGYII